MKEKKVFILAVPTIIIIICVIAGIGLIFYNRNFKKMSKADAHALAEKVALINNISCEIITETPYGNTTADYKVKDDIVLSSTSGLGGTYRIYDDGKNKLQIDDEGKEVYVYHDYQPEKDIFLTELCQVAKFLESENYTYTFIDYTKMNGYKVAHFTLEDPNNKYEVWLDKESGMILELDYSSKIDGEDWAKRHYRFQIGTVTDDIVKKPNLDGYETYDL